MENWVAQFDLTKGKEKAIIKIKKNDIGELKYRKNNRYQMKMFNG